MSQLLLENKENLIKVYTLKEYTANQAKCVVMDQVWKDRFIFPTLSSIQIDNCYQGLGLSYQLLDQVTKDNLHLFFLNYNYNFWAKMARKKRLPYKIILHGYHFGELIRKCQ